MFKDQANQLKAAEKEQVEDKAIIAKQKAEIEILKAQANQCQCGAFGQVKQMPPKSFIRGPKIVVTKSKITGTKNIPNQKTLDGKSVKELSQVKV